ncbi:MAG: carbohydrate ABC transporter permease [Actinomycetota bacterium]
MNVVIGSKKAVLGRSAVRYIFIAIVCMLVIFPLYWMVVTAIQPPDITLTYPPVLYPKSPNLHGFNQLFGDKPMGRWLLNSGFVAALTTLITTTFSILGAYALSWFKWRGKFVFGIMLLFTQMLPEALIVIPIYKIYFQFHLLNNLPALSLIHAAFVIPVGVWILRPAFESIPKEVSEAAQIDGCDYLALLRKIIIPLCSPAILAVGVVAFFASWGDFLLAVTMISKQDLYPASVGLASTMSQLDTPIQELLSGALIYGLPPVILYMFIQKYIISGLTAGAIKG